MIEYSRTLLWIVCAVMALGMAGTAWSQEGLGELGGDGLCPDRDCKLDGGADDELPEPGTGPNFTIPVSDTDVGDVSATLDVLGAIFQSINPGLIPEYSPTSVSFHGLYTICLRESGDAISLVGVENTREGLFAKIRKVSESPLGGQIIVDLNRDTPNYPGPLTVNTTAGDIDQTNTDLVALIGQSGYQFVETADYIIVKKDTHLFSGWDLNQVSFESTDPGITIGEVALEADELNSSDCDE